MLLIFGLQTLTSNYFGFKHQCDDIWFGNFVQIILLSNISAAYLWFLIFGDLSFTKFTEYNVPLVGSIMVLILDGCTFLEMFQGLSNLTSGRLDVLSWRWFRESDHGLS